MTKKCSMCQQEKLLEFFAKKTKSKDGRQSRCNSCMSKTMLNVYGSNKEEWNSRCKQQKGRKREWVNQLKSDTGCLVCQESDYTCLEFHHVDSKCKEETVSQMIANATGDERIQAEIDKCIVLCANHHRKLHAGHIICEVI